MADGTGQADIRGLKIDKIVKGYADEALILKNFVTVNKGSARQRRWYQKTAGYLDSTDTTGITASQIANIAERTKFPVIGQTWTRNTTYVRKYGVESETISEEDIMDNDVNVLMTTLRDLTIAVINQEEIRMYDVLTESLSPSAINTTAAVGTGWDDATNGDPVGDIMTAKRKIRSYRYNPEKAICYINSIEEENLVNFLRRNGVSYPSVGEEMAKKGVVSMVAGVKIVVSENATTDYALTFIPKRACTWFEMSPVHSHILDDPGQGKKIRVLSHGEAVLTDPRAVHLTTDTVT